MMLSFAVRPLVAPLTPLVVPFGTAAGAILFLCGVRIEGYSVVWEEEGFLGGCTVSRCMMISDCKAKISSMSEKCCANALLSSKTRT